MADSEFLKEVTQANRALLRAMRRHEAACRVVVARGVELGEAKRNLRLLIQAVEPYAPPAPELARAANDAADAV